MQYIKTITKWKVLWATICIQGLLAFIGGAWAGSNSKDLIAFLFFIFILYTVQILHGIIDQFRKSSNDQIKFLFISVFMPIVITIISLRIALI